MSLAPERDPSPVYDSLEERPPFDKLLSIFSYPIAFFVPLLWGVVILQAIVPAPRIGVDTLWEPGLRLLVGFVATLPAIVDLMFFCRRCRKRGMGPRFPAAQNLAAAVTGAALATLVAWALGATLTLGLGALAFVVTTLWIVATGIVAAYFAGLVWHLRERRREEYAAR